jgi:hypothetical protein
MHRENGIGLGGGQRHARSAFIGVHPRFPFLGWGTRNVGNTPCTVSAMGHSALGHSHETATALHASR